MATLPMEYEYNLSDVKFTIELRVSVFSKGFI